MKWLSRLALVALLAALLVPTTASAAEFRGGQELSTVPAGQTVTDDLYIAGQTVTISGTVDGDVVVAGSNVTIDGTVTGSVWAAGSNVTISGKVGHSVRVAGSDVTIKGAVAGDVLAGGSDVTVSSGAVIGRDLVVGAGQLTDNGSVGRNLKVAGDQVTLNGPVKGSVSAKSGSRFTLTKDASIAGGITYSGPTELKRDQGSTVAGAIDYTKTERNHKHETAVNRVSGQFYWFLASLLLLLAILLYARRAAVRGSELIAERPGTAVLYGLAFLILTPILGFVLLVTIVGLPLSVITFFAYWLAIYTAKLFPALALGGAILRTPKKDSFWPVFGAGAIGLVIYYLLTAIPFIGWIISLAAVLFGAGGQLLLFREVHASVKKKYGA